MVQPLITSSFLYVPDLWFFVSVYLSTCFDLFSFVYVYVCLGGESACWAHAVRAAGDGQSAAAANWGSAADARCKGNILSWLSQ